ncbi:hypothetical protein ACTFIZ_000388 [Dictyostelium cf. discoideum]
MKLITSLLIILSLVSNCLSQSSSSSSSASSASSSQEECPTGYSGVNCTTFTHYVTGYSAAYSHGGYVLFWGNFGNIHNGLSISIAGTGCSSNAIYETMIQCWIGSLPENTFYNVSITQNGVTWFKDNYYRYQTNCVRGQTNSGYCQCETGFTGELCDTEASPYIDTITSSSIDGGFVIAEGWFGYNVQLDSLSIFIGNKKFRTQNISPTRFNGVVPQGSGNQDITIYNSTNNELLFTGVNLFNYDSNLCFGDCFANGVCNNGVCECYFPWKGPYCFDFNSCQCPQN